VARGLEGFQFFGYALSHYYIHGTHLPGGSDLWTDFQQNAPARVAPNAAIGNPDEVRAYLERMEAAGVDQVIFIQQAGRNRHEHICESLELFAREVLPAFQERHAARASGRSAPLAPQIERALGRIAPLPDASPEWVDSYPVLMRKLATEPQSEVVDSPMVSAIAGQRTPS
jgi:hypothetical protein